MIAVDSARFDLTRAGAVVAVAVVAILMCASSVQPLDLELLDQIGLDQNLDTQIPLDLTFTDEKGRTVVLGDFLGDRPALLTLVYYECPMLCTQILNGLTRSLRVLSFDVGKEFDIITVSIDPGETPSLAAAKKAEYVKRYGRSSAERGWHFLTGRQDQIERLAQAVGFRYQQDPETGLYLHASGIMVLTPEGKLARYFYGVDYSPKDVRLGLIEASQNKIGSAMDQLLLLCYQYDPATGKYGLVIMNSIRIAAGLTVATMVGFVALMLRRERRANPRHGTAGPPA
jgi:protein SCO1/2